MSTRSRWLLVLACLGGFVSAACGESESDFVFHDCTSAGCVPLVDIEASYRVAMCEYHARCGLFPSKAACETAQIFPAAMPIDPNVVAAVRAGRVRYDAVRVKQCHAAIASRSCDTPQSSLPWQCSVPFFIGTLGDGKACTLAAECASSACSGVTSSDTCTVGECISDAPPVLSGPGGPCGSVEFQCAAGLWCAQYGRQCVLPRREGESCGSSYGLCGDGLVCSVDGVCKPLPSLGMACTQGIGCRAFGLYCDSATSTCMRVGLDGATCASYEQCSQYYPCTAQRCTRRPMLNEPCTISGGCFEAGTYCDATTAQCTETKDVGEPCDGDVGCKSNDCLNSVCNESVCYAS